MKIGQNLLTKMQHVQFTDRLKVFNKTARDKKKIIKWNERKNIQKIESRQTIYELFFFLINC